MEVSCTYHIIVIIVRGIIILGIVIGLLDGVRGCGVMGMYMVIHREFHGVYYVVAEHARVVARVSKTHGMG